MSNDKFYGNSTLKSHEAFISYALNYRNRYASTIGIDKSDGSKFIVELGILPDGEHTVVRNIRLDGTIIIDVKWKYEQKMQLFRVRNYIAKIVGKRCTNKMLSDVLCMSLRTIENWLAGKNKMPEMADHYCTLILDGIVNIKTSLSK